ncbi:uncharacterized protein LOC135486148 [Lineus longissimus]|uniref:uncharacterized protein LOC135486148 n=1 Tax=Lineus longissimus TaxID=88925 RepID=UPI00315DA123
MKAPLVIAIIAVIATLIGKGTSQSEPECKDNPRIADATGAKSKSSDDAKSTVKCQTGFVGQACKCDVKCDGSYFIDQETCVAFNRYSVGGVKAKVTCIEKACVKSRINLTSDGYVPGPTVTCPKDSELVSCSIYSPWSQSYPSFMTTKVTGNTCVGPSQCKKCRVQAVCIAKKEPECKDSPRIADATGAKSKSSDDAKSTVKCQTGFVGQACKCDVKCDGSYFIDQETCVAFNRYSVGGVKAKVTCIEKACVKSRINLTSDGYVPGPTVTCPKDSELVSCSIYSPWSQSYPSFMTTKVTGNTCVGPSQCKKCRVQAVCIAKKEPECKDSPRIADATGAKSKSSDDAKSTVKCQTGFVGQACKCDVKCDGSYFIDQETCVAFNRYSVGGVKAKVTCIEKACVKSRINLTSDGYVPGPTVTCPKDSELVSCSIYSPWSQSYPSFMTTKVTGNTCVGPSQCKKCRVQAVCIAMNEEPKKDCAPGYSLDVKTDSCVDLCPDYQQKWDGKECVKRCIASEKWDGKNCVLRCPLPNKYNVAFKTCEERICRCLAAGDPNYIQYDGQKVEFMGKCKYTFTKLRGADSHQKCYFNVEEKNVVADSSDLTYVKLVDVQVEDMTFRYNDHTKNVSINGIDDTNSKFPMTLKTKQGTDVIVSFANRKFTVDASACGMITSYRDSFLTTDIKSSLGKQVEGICGTCNGEKNDDLIGKGMKKSGNFTVFSSSWSVPDDSGLPVEGHCTSADVNGDCSVAWAKKVQNSNHCGAITDTNGSFKTCIASGSVDVDKFKESCEYDVCSASKGSTAAKDVPLVVCKTLAAFADACAAQGAGGVWRSTSFCPLKCETNEYYSPKKYAGCEKTCENKMVSTKCAKGEPEDGCTCKNSYVRLGNKCVHPRECGCEVGDGQHLDSGESVVLVGCKTKYECSAESVLKKVDFPACHDDATCSVVKGAYACKCNDGFDGNGHDCKSKCQKAEEKWDTKSSKCILRCPDEDTKWHIKSISCIPRCPDIQTKWDGKICALRCPNQDEQWSSVKSACILRCPDVNTKWDQMQGKCVDRCASHMQWDNQQKKCTSRCAAADKWEETKKKCTPRCPSHQDWKTDKCENKCPTGEKWHDPTNKCFQDVIYPKTEGGNGQEAPCVIPFLYGSKWQEDCVQGKEKMWCSTTENYDADKKWGYCPVMCRTKGGLIKFPGDAWTDDGKGVFCDTDGTIGMITGEFSLTTGGDGGGAGCVFPYLYNGRYHGKCVISTTLPWCGTLKDGSKWGYCPPQCMPKDGSRKNAGDWWMEGQMKYFCDENAVIEEIKDLSIKTKDGVQCVFPFKYNSKFYGGCTGTTPWCATTADYDADAKWGHCAVTCLTQDKKKVNAGATWSHGGKEYACGRDGKVRANVNTPPGNCLFPFSYKGNTYEKCTEVGSAGKPWCFIDEAEKAYGYC